MPGNAPGRRDLGRVAARAMYRWLGDCQQNYPRTRKTGGATPPGFNPPPARFRPIAAVTRHSPPSQAFRAFTSVICIVAKRRFFVTSGFSSGFSSRLCCRTGFFPHIQKASAHCEGFAAVARHSPLSHIFRVFTPLICILVAKHRLFVTSVIFQRFSGRLCCPHSQKSLRTLRRLRRACALFNIRVHQLLVLETGQQLFDAAAL